MSTVSKSLFFSGLVALPVPLVLPYAMTELAPNSPFSGVLEADYAVSYYVITWLLVAIAILVASLLQVGAVSAPSSGGRAKPAKTNAPAASADEGSELGSVKWFNVNKGFGFITTESGDDIFVHFRSIRGSGRRSLRQGQDVRFDITEGDKGLQAENVSVVGK